MAKGKKEEKKKLKYTSEDKERNTKKILKDNEESK